MNELQFVWKNLVRKRLRFALTLFAILVAFFIYGVLTSFQRSFDSGSDISAENRLITVNRINFTQPLPIAYVDRVRAVDGVAIASHQAWFGAYVRDPRNVIVAFAIEPQSYLDVYAGEIFVSPPEREAFLRNRQGMLVGERLALAQGWKVGDRVPVQSNIFSRADGSNTWDMVVEGIYRGVDERADTRKIYFHYDYLNEGRALGRDNTGVIVFNTVDPARNDQIARAVDAMFANSFFETQTDTARAFNKAFIAQLGNVALIIGSVVSAAFFTILLIVGNSMMLSIRERTTEIAVLKTIGFRSARIFRMVLAESLFLSICGGVAGIVLAALALGALSSALASTLPDLALGRREVLQAMLIMLGLGLVTGLLPALAAMRLNVVTALGRN
ncbi:MAG: ABC transporter permease [Gammaproteobacteria bacterium]